MFDCTKLAEAPESMELCEDMEVTLEENFAEVADQEGDLYWFFEDEDCDENDDECEDDDDDEDCDENDDECDDDDEDNDDEEERGTRFWFRSGSKDTPTKDSAIPNAAAKLGARYARSEEEESANWVKEEEEEAVDEGMCADGTRGPLCNDTK